MDGKESLEESINITPNKFLNAIKLLIEKPHVVNKKICGFEFKWIGVTENGINIEDITKKLMEIMNDKNSLPPQNKMESLCEILLSYNFIIYDKNVCRKIPWSNNFASIAVIRNILPKNIDIQNSLIEIFVIDIFNSKISFIPEVSSHAKKFLPEFPYMLYLIENSIQLQTFKSITTCNHGYKWLKNHLLPVLTKWANQMSDTKHVITSSSLCLLDVQKYNEVYQNLKRKYGKQLMEIWTETTDPLKFIYEDIAIATYLIVLWEQERKTKQLEGKQSFLDLGCGNGLLVYILSSEGHPGLGIDIKKRKLWTKFPDNVYLKEEVILPSDKCLYPDYDWLIGNHSDELTPWLPVIAAKSSISTRYFLMPCCAHDFQSKFQRNKSGMSQYAEYLDYIQEIGSICGFEVWKDKLRIPSTKRTCFIGQNRTYSDDKWNEIITQITDFVNNRCSVNMFQCEKSQTSELWCADFKPRESVQKTRNCTQISTEIRDKLVNDIGYLLLSEQNLIQIKKGDDVIDWNRGGSYSMKNLASILSTTELRHLKNECGGLQTLLRNHKFIFKLDKGNITLRIPESAAQRSVRCDLVKTKKCWFNFHHPQGCILQNEDCTYIH